MYSIYSFTTSYNNVAWKTTIYPFYIVPLYPLFGILHTLCQINCCSYVFIYLFIYCLPIHKNLPFSVAGCFISGHPFFHLVALVVTSCGSVICVMHLCHALHKITKYPHILLHSFWVTFWSFTCIYLYRSIAFISLLVCCLFYPACVFMMQHKLEQCLWIVFTMQLAGI